MNSYPSGTVTFLFTDIEGSTKLAQDHPDNMPSLLMRHNDILHQAIESNRGAVFEIVGDSFCAAFHDATDALKAALVAQTQLQSETRTPVPLKVRMGIHTGAAQWNMEIKPPRYSGYATLALTQRIMSAGHGGQVLLSQTAHDLVKDQLTERAELRDLGEHRLKDVLQPEHLYQVVLPGLVSDFQPLNTLDTFNHNLPAQLTSFIGRTAEISTVKKLLQDNVLVTLTGSGGCGKTRLSIQVAGELLSGFAHGVWFVELAPLADPAQVPQAVIATLNLRADHQRTPLQVLTDYARTKQMLLLLDNCEHLIEACATLSEALLRTCPKLKILASSREALGVVGEMPYRVPSLKTPNPEHLPALDELSEMDAVRLFLERAAVAKPDFQLTGENAPFVAQICSRLDGIPLAIELAAARIKVLSVQQIARRLDDRFRLLTGGARTALPRQQTLRAMIDWSYSLLSEPEKLLFRRLAVFIGGWTLEAAESIGGEEGGEVEILDLLTRLVDKSLVNTEELAGETRYRYLETIRQYAREKLLDSDEVETLRNRHLAFYVQFSEESERQMQGPARKVWARRSEAEQDNLSAAVEWGLAQDPESALWIAANLVIGITSGGLALEGFSWLREGLARMEATLSAFNPSLRAKALSAQAFVYFALGDNFNGKRVAESSVALYRQIGDKRGLAFALVVLGYPLDFLGELEQAKAVLEEGITLARAEKNAYVRAWGLDNLARLTVKLGDTASAMRYTAEAIRIAGETGIEYVVAYAYQVQGLIAAESGQYEQAKGLYEQAALAFQDLGARFNVLLVKSDLAHLERQLGHYALALERYRETILAFRDVGQLGAVAHQLECFGFIALAQNQDARALTLFAAAQALRDQAGTPMTPDEQVYFDGQMQVLQARTEGSVLQSIWSSGSNLSMDDAITLAIEAPHD